MLQPLVMLLEAFWWCWPSPGLHHMSNEDHLLQSSEVSLRWHSVGCSSGKVCGTDPQSLHNLSVCKLGFKVSTVIGCVQLTQLLDTLCSQTKDSRISMMSVMQPPCYEVFWDCGFKETPQRYSKGCWGYSFLLSDHSQNSGIEMGLYPGFLDTPISLFPPPPPPLCGGT